MSNLTTHVLDTSQGKPAEGMKVQLFKIEDKKSVQLAEVITNKDGRVDQKLLKSENNIGTYELRFFAGDYFNKENLKLTKIKFLDEITIRFGISDDTHYHVPLLISPMDIQPIEAVNGYTFSMGRSFS